jgi:steroid 5-alpha reductase family enzyme
MKNLILILHAVVLIMSLSIVIMPNLWMVSVVTGEEGMKGIVFPVIWTVYGVVVFLASAVTFSWLIRR